MVLDYFVDCGDDVGGPAAAVDVEGFDAEDVGVGGYAEDVGARGARDVCSWWGRALVGDGGGGRGVLPWPSLSVMLLSKDQSIFARPPKTLFSV